MDVVGRLLVLLAVLLMPLGMEPAAASAVHHPAMAMGATQHCPDQPDKPTHRDGIATCTSACASALPVDNWPAKDVAVRQRQVVEPRRQTAIHGILPEMATPPPRHG